MKKRPANLEDHQPLRDEQVNAVADLFAILADPTRLKILNVLRAGEATVSEIVQKLEMKQPNISKHLGLLYQAGLLEKRRDGLQIHYMIRQPVVFALCSAVCDHIRQATHEQARLFG